MLKTEREGEKKRMPVSVSVPVPVAGAGSRLSRSQGSPSHRAIGQVVSKACPDLFALVAELQLGPLGQPAPQVGRVKSLLPRLPQISAASSRVSPDLALPNP